MSDDPRKAIVGAWMPGVEQGLFKAPDFETVTLDRAALAYGQINDSTARKKQVNALPPLKVVQLLGNACLSPTTLAPKGPFRPRGPKWILWFSLDSVEPHRVTSNDLVGALGAIPAAWWRTSHDVLARLACPPKPGPVLMGIVQLAESQGAIHAKTTQTGPDRGYPPRLPS